MKEKLITFKQFVEWTFRNVEQLSIVHQRVLKVHADVIAGGQKI